MSAVVCACQLAREKETHRCVVASFPIAPSLQSAALFKETRERGEDKNLGKTTDNDRYSLEYWRENTVPLSLHKSVHVYLVGQFKFIVHSL